MALLEVQHQPVAPVLESGSRRRRTSHTQPELPSHPDLILSHGADHVSMAFVLSLIFEPKKSSFERWWEATSQIAVFNLMAESLTRRDLAFCEARRSEIKLMTPEAAVPVWNQCFEELQAFEQHYGHLSESDQQRALKLVFDTIRICPGVTVLSGTQRLLRLQNVGPKVATAILDELGNRCYQWGDLCDQRRRRYGAKTGVSDAHERLDSVFGFNHQLFELDRELGQELAARFTLPELAILVGVPVSTLVSSRVYQPVLDSVGFLAA